MLSVSSLIGFIGYTCWWSVWQKQQLQHTVVLLRSWLYQAQWLAMQRQAKVCCKITSSVSGGKLETSIGHEKQATHHFPSGIRVSWHGNFGLGSLCFSASGLTAGQQGAFRLSNSSNSYQLAIRTAGVFVEGLI